MHDHSARVRAGRHRMRGRVYSTRKLLLLVLLLRLLLLLGVLVVRRRYHGPGGWQVRRRNVRREVLVGRRRRGRRERRRGRRRRRRNVTRGIGRVAGTARVHRRAGRRRGDARAMRSFLMRGPVVVHRLAARRQRRRGRRGRRRRGRRRVRQSVLLMLRRRAIVVRPRGRAVNRATRRRDVAGVRTRRHPLLLPLALRGREVALLDRRRPRGRLHVPRRRGRRCDRGRLVDGALGERNRGALGYVRMVVAGVILGSLCYDRRARLRLSIVGSLISRLVRRGEYLRGRVRGSGDGVQLLVDGARGIGLLRRLHLMQMGRGRRGRGRWLLLMVMLVMMVLKRIVVGRRGGCWLFLREVRRGRGTIGGRYRLHLRQGDDARGRRARLHGGSLVAWPRVRNFDPGRLGWIRFDGWAPEAAARRRVVHGRRPDIAEISVRFLIVGVAARSRLRR